MLIFWRWLFSFLFSLWRCRPHPVNK